MNWNKPIAILFSIICLILSIGMFLLSREDAHLAYGALWFLISSIYLLRASYIFFQKKQFAHNTVWFIVTAVSVASTIIPVFWITVMISNAEDAAITANFKNTQVTNFHDEILFSEKNNPIGIRLSYEVAIPRSGRYFPEPSISFDNSRSENFHFYLSGVKIDPLPQLERQGVSLIGNYDAGVSYKIITDLKPSFLPIDQKTGNPCIYFYDSDKEKLVKNAAPERMEVDIDGTSFNRYYGQGIHYLNNNYNLQDFYDSAVKEDIAECTGF